MQECFKDAALRDAIMAMPEDVEPADHAVKIASTRGYAFAAADVQTYYDEQKTREANGELPDWELEAVAGGAGGKPGRGLGPAGSPAINASPGASATQFGKPPRGGLPTGGLPTSGGSTAPGGPLPRPKPRIS